ncbi:urea carboxylase-associated family protein [Nonomuraea mesophila]|uniref:Urea carboxylase-associated family protein n=1 Tax=Nonomuraea mesophila TaxID=2530382 RepID=A0A4R5FX29_9ACTN|nr:urea carboxylase-associated family protein [Nonomuraea mesophila]TDE59743.1 urea carboxylase-associated family protein [Nonomuraea mesophila]
MRVIVPAAEGRAVKVGAGQRVRVTDLEGSQVGDLFVFAAGDLTEHLSASHTRAVTSRLFPAVGEQFVTDRRRPILTLVEDTSPGVHDMLIAACDPARYRALGVSGFHASCADNLRRSLASLDLASAHTPQPVNLFMRIPVSGDGRLSWLSAISRPGDAITFEAAMDCVLAVSACPQDLVEVNGPRPTSLAIDLLSDHNPRAKEPAQ